MLGLGSASRRGRDWAVLLGAVLVTFGGWQQVVVQAGVPQADLAPTSGSCFLQGQAAGGGCCMLASLSSSEGCACAGCSSCSSAWCCLCPALQPLPVLWLHWCQAAPRGRAKGFSSAAAGQRLFWESLGGSFQSRQCWGLWAQPPPCSFFLLARAGLPQAVPWPMAATSPWLCPGSCTPALCTLIPLQLSGAEGGTVALCPQAGRGAPRLGLSWGSLTEQQCPAAAPGTCYSCPQLRAGGSCTPSLAQPCPGAGEWQQILVAVSA